MDINEAYENLGYKKVFASLDGSDLQYDVLARAIVIASNNHAELYVGHVIDATVFEGTGISIGSVVPKLEQAFRDQIAPLIDDAKANPRIPNVEVQIKVGRIRETLKEKMIDVIEPDVIACGARGLSSIKYALLGSISTYLLRNCTCDILVVKRPAIAGASKPL